MTARDQTLLDAEQVVTKLNRMLKGWAMYFCRGPVSTAYRNIDLHVRHRLRQWLTAKHKVPGQGIAQFPNEYLYQELGLTQLTSLRSASRVRHA